MDWLCRVEVYHSSTLRMFFSPDSVFPPFFWLVCPTFNAVWPQPVIWEYIHLCNSPWFLGDSLAAFGVRAEFL